MYCQLFYIYMYIYSQVFINLFQTQTLIGEKKILRALNDKFAQLIEKLRISEAYGKIVRSKPYKVLSCFAYDWKFAPLKRGITEPRSPKPSARREEVDFFHPSHQ